MFEIAKRIAVEQEKNGNHFCIAHSSLSIASFRGVWRGIWKRKCFCFQFQLIFFAEIICNTIDFHNFADKFQRIVLLLYDWFSIVYIQKNNPLFRLLLKLYLGEKEELLIPNWGFSFSSFCRTNSFTKQQSGSAASRKHCSYLLGTFFRLCEF